MKNIAAIILAAGRGKRMNSEKTNKVVSTLGKKQMILHTIDRLNELFISPVIVVVGFAKESVMRALGNRVIYAHQSKRLGTAHAVICALKKLPKDIKTVLVLGGDDSAFYTKEIIENLIKLHRQENAAMSFLTITVDNPAGLGRVMRGNNGNVTGIIEEKDATENQKIIKEINPGCYIFEVSFLKKYLKKIKKSPVSGEYYLTSLIDIAINNKEKLTVAKGGKILWRGINTPQELKEAEKLFLNIK
jgi:bifunctional UDP-N-acetylglucosamine pyrophosphorylase / glucosamine-1-phosphate N-acetyltransferase